MRNIRLRGSLPFTVPEIIDLTDDLPKKASWESLNKKYVVKGVWDKRTYHTGFRNLNDLTEIVVHHSGPPNGTLESHARYHASKWGCGISYHCGIDQGMIKQLNDLRSFTYHAGNNNSHTVSVVVNRNLQEGDLTDEERKLLYAAILTIKSLIPTITEIKGHNEMITCHTACPVTDMNRIRADIAELELHMEEHAEYTNSTPANIVEAFAVGKRIEALWKSYNDEKWKAVAESKIMQLADVTGRDTPKEICERVADLYRKAQEGAWQGEAIRKLLLISAVMKSNGMI